MHGYDIGISLNHIDTVLTPYGLACLIDAEELMVLMVNIRVGRVDILLLDTLRGLVEFPAAKCDDLSVKPYPWEYGTACKAVGEQITGIILSEGGLAVTLIAETGLEKELGTVAFPYGLRGHGTAVVEGKAETETLNDIVAEST